jgi:cell volume regulation protein A
LLPVAGVSLAVAFVLMFVARPLGVMVALAASRFSWRDRTYISWVGLRGATPIILATFPLLAGIGSAPTVFNVVFFIVLTSVLLQGTTLARVARWLGVLDPEPPPRSPLAFAIDDGVLANDLLELVIPTGAGVAGRSIVDLHLPDEVLVVLIGRGNETVVPRGSGQLQAGDRVLMIAPPLAREALTRLFTRPRDDA